MSAADYSAVAYPETYADDHRMQALFARMRREAPVVRIETPDYPTFWALTKHADVLEVSRDHEHFLNEPRAVLQPHQAEAFARQLTGTNTPVRSLVQMDDPDHRKYRKLTQSWFLASNLRKLQPDLERLAREHVDRMAEQGGECDFVRDVAVWYPLRVIMTILGVPPEDEPRLLRLTQELFGPADPDMARQVAPEEMMQILVDFNEYFGRLTADRRANPRDDLASVLANGMIDGAPLPEYELNSYYTIVATAGHDTTSSSIAGGMLALLEHPDELERLREDPGMLASTADEMIRWTTPVKHFLRTATRPTTIRGQEIAADECVMLCYASANRDEEVFDEPDRFRIDRDPNPHLAFGFGAHLCLGRVLAKMEIEAVFRELLSRVRSIELAGEPRRVVSNFVSGLKTLPIRFEMR